MSQSEQFIDDFLDEHPIWIVHRIPQPNHEPAMRTLQQELRKIPLARSTFFAWAWDKPTLRVPIVSGRAEGTGGKGRVKSLMTDDLMWAFVANVPSGLWAQQALLAGLEGWTPAELIIRAALRRAVKDWHHEHPLVAGTLAGMDMAITDLELLARLAPTVIPADRATEVLTLATVMG